MGDKVLLDLVKNQYAFEQIMSSYLYEGIEFNKLKEPERWWPMGEDRRVVLDPNRSFGAPICVEGVPTRILVGSMEAEQDATLVSRLYEVSLGSVNDSVEFQARWAA